MSIVATHLPASPRAPLAPLCLNSPGRAPAFSPRPASDAPDSARKSALTVADLLCHERMPSREQFAGFAPSYTDLQSACWCFEPCPSSGPCQHARTLTHPPSRKRKASPPPSRENAPVLNWTQQINLWHPTDFTKTVVSMDCNLTFRAVFDELCRDERVPRASVEFVWNRRRSNGAVQLVQLHDSDTPLDVGMRDGLAPETVEADFR